MHLQDKDPIRSVSKGCDMVNLALSNCAYAALTTSADTGAVRDVTQVQR